MRQLILATFLVSATTHIRDAVAAQPVPEIPNRYQVSGYAMDKEPTDPVAFNEKTPLQDVSRVLLDPAESDLRKAQAANLLNEQIGRVYYNPRPEFWQAADILFDLLNKLFALPPGSASRRHSVFIVFTNLCAQVRSAVIDQPEDPQWKPHWTRAHDIVIRGLADKDARLKEFFERFVLLPTYPNWKATKAGMKKLHERILTAYPADKDILNRIWKTCQKMENDQLGEKAKYDRQIEAMKLNANKKRRLLSFHTHIYDYRNYTIWANQYPWIMREGIGQQASDEFKLTVAPVKNGWPNY